MTAKRLLVSTIVSALALATVAAMQYPTSGQQNTPAPPGFPSGQHHDLAWQYGQFRNDAANFAQQYVKSEKEDERRELRRKMEDTLAKEFDAQAKRQEQDIKDLEAQIRKLRELMEKRKDHRDEIIKRRIEQLITDAAGLGWNAPGSSRSPLLGGGFGTFPSPVPVAPAQTIPPVGGQNTTPRGTPAPRP
jgi:hypothetical protein